MIVELIVDQLKPRTLPAFEAEFKKALPKRTALSPLGGIWRTEVGNLNQVVQLWPYESARQRGQVLLSASKLPAWRTIERNAASLGQEVRLLQPAPFSPPLTARKLGNLYEMRTYDYAAGAIPAVIERWQLKLDARLKLSPLVFCGYTSTGQVHQWVHIWAYEDALQRQRIRDTAVEQKIWPPDATTGLLFQRNMLLVPAGFSPLN